MFRLVAPSRTMKGVVFGSEPIHTQASLGYVCAAHLSATSLYGTECRRYSFSATCENRALARREGATIAALAAEAGPVEETSVRISFSIPWSLF